MTSRTPDRVSTMAEVRRRWSRRSGEVQTRQRQPMTGTPCEVPVPKKVSFMTAKVHIFGQTAASFARQNSSEVSGTERSSAAGRTQVHGLQRRGLDDGARSAIQRGVRRDTVCSTTRPHDGTRSAVQRGVRRDAVCSTAERLQHPHQPKYPCAGLQKRRFFIIFTNSKLLIPT